MHLYVGTDIEQSAYEIERQIFDALNTRFPYFFVIINPQLGFDYVGEGTFDLVGFTRDEVSAMSIDELLHPEDLSSAAPMALEMMSTGTESIANPSAAQTIEIPLRVRTKDGGWVPMTLSGRVMDESGRILCVLRPDAERHALNKVLQMVSGAQGAVGLDDLLHAVLELVLTQFTASMATVLDPRGAVVVSRGIGSDLAAPLVQAPAIAAFEQWNVRVERFVDGSEFWSVPVVGDLSGTDYGRLVVAAPRLGGPSPFDALVFRQTADLARLAFARARFDEMLNHAANTDHLTGALNRRAVERYIESLGSQPHGDLAVLFIDLNGFKSINDRFGHRSGDQVLRITAQRIADSLRSADMLGRLGGDEFVVLCHRADDLAVSKVRERIERVLTDPIDLGSHRIPLSASIGVAFARSDDEFVDVLHRSDLDMYARKAERRALRSADW